jgi:NitT/TauT family transport system ATP-binding protein
MQQRVAMARAIASESELLLVDEPLAALDAQTRAELQDLLRLQRERKARPCSISHSGKDLFDVWSIVWFSAWQSYNIQ